MAITPATMFEEHPWYTWPFSLLLIIFFIIPGCLGIMALDTVKEYWERKTRKGEEAK